MQDKQGIVFTTTVTERNWDEVLNGWRCPALKIPGAELESVFVPGKTIDSSWYKVDYDLQIVRWGHSKAHPPEAVFSIKLTEELSKKELTLWWRQLAIVLPVIATIASALITGVITYIISVKPAPLIVTSSCPEEVKIIDPTDNAAVLRPVTVRWKAKDLAPGDKVYIMIFPTEIRRYYPQPKTATEELNGTWSVETSIGNDSDVGKIFFIYAVVADKDAQITIDAYINRFKATDDSPGLFPDLPKGARICSSVGVKRK